MRVRLPPWIQGELKRLAAGEQRSLSAVVHDLLDEALRMRRCPGIVFVDGPTGRRPVLAGAGLEVWEVIRAYKDCGEDFEKLKETLDWLSPWQLRDALHYWHLYPEEIEEELRRQEELKARAAELYPHLFPRL